MAIQGPTGYGYSPLSDGPSLDPIVGPQAQSQLTTAVNDFCRSMTPSLTAGINNAPAIDDFSAPIQSLQDAIDAISISYPNNPTLNDMKLVAQNLNSLANGPFFPINDDGLTPDCGALCKAAVDLFETALPNALDGTEQPAIMPVSNDDASKGAADAMHNIITASPDSKAFFSQFKTYMSGGTLAPAPTFNFANVLSTVSSQIVSALTLFLCDDNLDVNKLVTTPNSNTISELNQLNGVMISVYYANNVPNGTKIDGETSFSQFIAANSSDGQLNYLLYNFFQWLQPFVS